MTCLRRFPDFLLLRRETYRPCVVCLDVNQIEAEDTEVLQTAIEVLNRQKEEGAMSLHLSSDDTILRTDPNMSDEGVKQIDPGEEFPRSGVPLWSATREEIESELDDREEEIPSA